MMNDLKIIPVVISGVKTVDTYKRAQKDITLATSIKKAETCLACLLQHHFVFWHLMFMVTRLVLVSNGRSMLNDGMISYLQWISPILPTGEPYFIILVGKMYTDYSELCRTLEKQKTTGKRLPHISSHKRV